MLVGGTHRRGLEQGGGSRQRCAAPSSFLLRPPRQAAAPEDNCRHARTGSRGLPRMGKGTQGKKSFSSLGDPVFNHDNVCESLDEGIAGRPWLILHTVSHRSFLEVPITPGWAMRIDTATHLRHSREDRQGENRACSHQDHNLDYPFCKSS